ncbi:hypothetical protein [Deinococcus sp.]|uniref:hypothetical protein n=1 Tax=Deinococcus sp. TaxID=47478 RepID=UPI003C7E66D5
MPEPLQIVATTTEQAARLAPPWQAAGFRVQSATPAEFRAAGPGGYWWVTADAADALGPDAIQARVKTGGKILLDGPGKASTALLGLRPTGISGRQAQMSGVSLAWDSDVAGLRPSVAGTVLASTVLAGTTATATGQGSPALFQAGALMWSLPRLDQGLGVRRLPYLPQVLHERWGLDTPAERHDLDLYVDPDLLTGKMTLPERLRQWQQDGVRRVYVAAWKEDQTRGYRYDYAGFVKAAHAAGIEVYAWLAWPNVTLGFWKQHPDCREITASGLPAHVFWREHVALELPRCFDLAWAATAKLLGSAPFDGVNVAELYFESPVAGKADPATYTPMHPELRKAFAAQHGFDPVSLFDVKNPIAADPAAWSTWTLYREALLTGLHAKLLGRLKGIPAGTHLMTTLIDNRLDAKLSAPLGEHIGLNVGAVLALRPQTGFQVQIEDPYLFWATDPARYARLPGLYPEVNSRDLLLDINVVDRDTWPKGLVTRRLGGFEFDAAVSAAGVHGGGVVLYAASTVLDADLSWARFALAGQSVQLQEGSIQAGKAGQIQTVSVNPFWLRLARDAHSATLDGQAVNLSQPRLILIPAGSHALQLR